MLTFAIAGGLFVILTFVHFFADWIFQTHHEATNKHSNFAVRGKHCIIYTAAFVPVLLLMGITGWGLVISIFTLYLSHFIIDTYVPVFLWAKYFRRIPALRGKEAVKGISTKDTQAIFKWLWTQPVYPILFIAIDQILHLSFLWVVVIIALL